jgi:uncharacterized damage-inducible protein DinB
MTTLKSVPEALAAEVMHESATTRRVLERVPDDKLSWKPHPKSMSLGTLALHIAVIPGRLAEFFSEPTRQAPQFTPPEATSRQQILDAHDASRDEAVRRLTSWTEADLAAEFKMLRGDRTLFALPRVDGLRSIMFNHLYHHRGQLSVYLRLLDVPVPSIYGPSADDNPMR